MQEGQKLRIQELTDFLTGLGQELKEYDEQMVRRYIERITVRENCYEVAFKAGIKIEIENNEGSAQSAEPSLMNRNFSFYCSPESGITSMISSMEQ